jgi:hypothetical protein
MRHLLLLTLFASAAANAADVGVSVEIGEPGFYGRIDIGSFPQPRVLFPTPVVIRPIPVGVVRQPLYLKVPPGHEKHWDKHCAEYNACGYPVFFVEEGWYNTVYVPESRAKHGRGGGKPGKGHDKGKGKGKGRD